MSVRVVVLAVALGAALASDGAHAAASDDETEESDDIPLKGDLRFVMVAVAIVLVFILTYICRHKCCRHTFHARVGLLRGPTFLKKVEARLIETGAGTPNPTAKMRMNPTAKMRMNETGQPTRTRTPPPPPDSPRPAAQTTWKSRGKKPAAIRSAEPRAGNGRPHDGVVKGAVVVDGVVKGAVVVDRRGPKRHKRIAVAPYEKPKRNSDNIELEDFDPRSPAFATSPRRH